MKLLKKLCNNKNIIIVGPAPTLIGYNEGEFINSFDIVIRINNSLFSLNCIKNDYGNRTDIIYCNGYFWRNKAPDIVNELNNNNIKLIRNKNKIISLNNTEECKIYNNYTYKRFNMGILCILEIIKNIKFKKLVLAGFSFYDKKINNYHEDYQLTIFKKNFHVNLQNQKTELLNEINNNNNIIIFKDCKEFFK